MKRTIFLFFLFFCTHSFAQKVAIKNNLAYDALKTPNLSLEFSMGRKWTLDTQVGMNFFFYTQDATSSRYKTKKASHWLVQPELRYWIYEPFNGHFLGAHLLYTFYNVGGVKMPLGIFPDLKDYRYEGNGYGVGFSYGYQWLLSNRWNLEATFGFGYIYLDHSRYECRTCGEKLNRESKHYLGPTKVGVSLIYVIK